MRFYKEVVQKLKFLNNSNWLVRKLWFLKVNGG